MPVTVSNLLTAALALMGADPAATDYAAHTLPSVNLMLCDLFGVNNALLEASGQAELGAMPAVSAVGDTVPYREELTRGVMPYGLARDLARRDGNASITPALRNISAGWKPHSVRQTLLCKCLAQKFFYAAACFVITFLSHNCNTIWVETFFVMFLDF